MPFSGCLRRFRSNLVRQFSAAAFVTASLTQLLVVFAADETVKILAGASVAKSVVEAMKAFPKSKSIQCDGASFVLELLSSGDIY